MLIDVLTDNRNRTGSEIRSRVQEERRLDGRARRGGLAVRAQGRGARPVDRSTRTTLMLAALDAGAEDLVDEGDTWRLTTAPHDLPAVRAALEDGRHHDRVGRHSPWCRAPTIPLDSSRGGQEGPAADRRPRGQRRRPGRVRQLRHPRRHHGGGRGLDRARAPCRARRGPVLYPDSSIRGAGDPPPVRGTSTWGTTHSDDHHC